VVVEIITIRIIVEIIKIVEEITHTEKMMGEGGVKRTIIIIIIIIIKTGVLIGKMITEMIKEATLNKTGSKMIEMRMCNIRVITIFIYDV
jgi:hypothetical protein